ncbi:hypothetical protein AAES_122242 [Amazona aestiva]|uniref:Uncharacterized protein n=1 Tax=Amazona aestiva TaxID=12930 RepID=A0A0Q3QXD7_AMAAE|nr:hypothetical protein AAES_122242 [Amazona aestiva]
MRIIMAITQLSLLGMGHLSGILAAGQDLGLKSRFCTAPCRGTKYLPSTMLVQGNSMTKLSNFKMMHEKKAMEEKSKDQYHLMIFKQE